MHHVSASPFKTVHQYQDYRKYNINDYELKSSIFIEVDDLCSTGSNINRVSLFSIPQAFQWLLVSCAFAPTFTVLCADILLRLPCYPV
jgi:hypothetical protein